MLLVGSQTGSRPLACSVALMQLVNALGSCAQLLACSCDLEGTPRSSVPQTCAGPQIPLLNDLSVGLWWHG